MKITFTNEDHTMINVEFAENKISCGLANTFLSRGLITQEDLDNATPWTAPVPSVQEQIGELEKQQTPRRLREAALGDVDSVAFLKTIDDDIRALRASAGMVSGKIKKKGIISKVLG